MNIILKSNYGYNSSVREGVIYKMQKDDFIYIIKTNKDLINVTYWFKYFSWKIKSYLLIKVLIKKINIIKTLRYIELGQTTWNKIISNCLLSSSGSGSSGK